MHPQSIKLEQSALDAEIAHILTVFEQKEAEDTWERMEDSLLKLSSIVRGSSHLPGIVGSVKRLRSPITQALATDRTRLARTAMSLVQTLATELPDRFEGLAEFSIPAVLKLCLRANKVIVHCANATIKVIIAKAEIPYIIPQLLEALSSPSKTLRQSAADFLKDILETCSTQRLEHYGDAIETAIKMAAIDSTPEVRADARVMLDFFKVKLPHRYDRFAMTLPDGTAKNLRVTKPTGVPGVAPLSSRKSAPSRTKAASLPRQRTDDDFGEVPSMSLSFSLPPTDADTDVAVKSKHQSLGSESLSGPVLLRGAQRLSYQTPGNAAASGTTSSSSALSSGARRLVVERPNRTTGGDLAAIPPDHFSGAVRVPRDDTSMNAQRPIYTPAGLPPRAKAMRVPAAAAAAEPHGPFNASRTNQSQQLDDADAVSLASSSTSRQSKSLRTSAYAPSVASSSSTATRPRPMSIELGLLSNNLPDIHLKMKNSDWGVRLRSLETLNGYIKASVQPLAHPGLVSEVRSKLGRIYEIYQMGIVDNHSKCLNASIVGIAATVDGYGCDDVVLDAVIPRLVGIFLLPKSAKVKPSLIESGRKLLDVFKLRKGTDLCAVAAAQALHNPELAKSLRIRVGCLGLLAELSDEEWSLFVTEKPAALRIIVARLYASSGDSDPAIQKYLRTIFAALNDLAPEPFWVMWANAKPSEKRAMNALFGSKDLSVDKKELESARKPIHAVVNTLIGTAPAKRVSTAMRRSNRSNSSPADPTDLNSEEINTSLTGRSFSATTTPSTRSRSKTVSSIRKTDLSSFGGDDTGTDISTADDSHSGATRKFQPPKFASDDDDDGSSNGIMSRLGYAYDDSDTDWFTDSEIVRDGNDGDSDSSDGESAAKALPNKLPVRVKSTNGLAVGKPDSTAAKATSPQTTATGGKNNTTRPTLKSIMSKENIQENKHIIEAAGALTADLSNEQFIESLDDVLINLSLTEKAGMRVAQQQSIEALSRTSSPRGAVVPRSISPVTPATTVKGSRSGIPVISPVPSSATATPHTLRPAGSPSPRFSRTTPSPSGESVGMIRTSSLPGPSFTQRAVSPPQVPGNLRFASAPVPPVAQDLQPSRQPLNKPTSNSVHFATPERPFDVPAAVDHVLIPLAGSATFPISRPRVGRPRSGGFMGTAPVTPSGLKNVVVVPPSPSNPSTPTPDNPQDTPLRKDSVVSITSSSAGETTSTDLVQMEADLACAIETSNIDELYNLSLSKQARDLFDTRMNDIVNAVVVPLQDRDLPAKTIRSGLLLLKNVVGAKLDVAIANAADILLAILRCDSKADISSDDQLEIDFEADLLIKQFQKMVPTTKLLRAVAIVLDAPSAFDHRVCFELLATLVGKEDAELPDPNAPSLDDEEGSVDAWNWTRVLGHVADGLDSKKATTRKSAFDCALALCTRYGRTLSTRLFQEVGSRSGKSREMVIKGMMERRLR